MRIGRPGLIDDKYRIVRLLGRGGSASVYEAVNVRINRRVALKTLSQEVLGEPGIVERFHREANAVTLIDSPHVVDVFDLGSLEDGRPYFVMELLEGADLAQELIEHGRLEPHRVLEIAIPVLRGLAHAHAAGVFHRDIKPANIFLSRSRDGRETVKLVDFGISRVSSVPRMTLTHGVLGTPLYMSPEQCSRSTVDQRSDLYSLGVVLYESLTGRVPHAGGSLIDLLEAIVTQDVPDPRSIRPDLDADLSRIVCKMLARDPAARYATAGEVEEALLEWARQHGLEAAPDRTFREKGRPDARPRSAAARRRWERGAAFAAAVTVAFAFVVTLRAIPRAMDVQIDPAFASEERAASAIAIPKAIAGEAPATRPASSPRLLAPAPHHHEPAPAPATTFLVQGRTVHTTY